MRQLSSKLSLRRQEQRLLLSNLAPVPFLMNGTNKHPTHAWGVCLYKREEARLQERRRAPNDLVGRNSNSNWPLDEVARPVLGALVVATRIDHAVLAAPRIGNQQGRRVRLADRPNPKKAVLVRENWCFRHHEVLRDGLLRSVFMTGDEAECRDNGEG